MTEDPSRGDLDQDTRTQILTDLTWLGSAPGLLRDAPNSLAIIQRTCAALATGDIQMNDAQMSVLMSRRPGPLGRYFEALVHAVLSLTPRVSSFHPNVVIHDGKRTRGELDVLYRCDGCWVHLELAVKFYLGLDNRLDPFQWCGPAARDTLGRKLARLYDHQLRLPQTDAGKTVLAQFDVDTLHSEALVMGMLFHPVTQWLAGEMDVPAMVSEKHPAGWWLRVADLNTLREMPGTSWQILRKPKWLSPTVPTLEDYSDLDNVFEDRENYPLTRPVMVAALIDGTECHRGFVVPDNWPPA